MKKDVGITWVSILVILVVLGIGFAAYSQERASQETVAPVIAPVAAAVQNEETTIFLATNAQIPAPIEEKAEDVSAGAVKGDVVSIDLEKSIIVIKQTLDEASSASEDVIYSIDANTVVTKNGDKIAISDLKAGDKISLIYSAGEEGKKIVSLIMIEG